jgi:DNA-binding NtrC family response regulator
MAKILVVETDGALQQLLQHQLASDRISIDVVRTIDAILDKFSQTTYDLVLWDIRGGLTGARRGLELLEVLSVDSPRTQVLVVTDSTSIPLAVDWPQGRCLSLSALARAGGGALGSHGGGFTAPARARGQPAADGGAAARV